MNSNFINTIYNAHQERVHCASSMLIHSFFDKLIGILFPNFSDSPVENKEELEKRIRESEVLLLQILHKNDEAPLSPEEAVALFYESLPSIYNTLQTDIDATFNGDPAAKSKSEIVRAYPGFYAIAAYRIAHQLYLQDIPHIPRLITEYAHSKTGVDIHPGARIDESFCIDHGTGIVIGETTEIGKFVKLYQGVTLGALSVNKHDASVKRHPTIEDGVILYAGATILGGKTIIGKNSIIGGNVWLTGSVPENSKIYYKARMHNDAKETTDTIIFKP